MSYRELLASATAELERAGVPSPRVDAEWLLAHALGISRTDLYANSDEAPDDREQLFRELVARRASREPLAYVLGEWGFRRLVLRVDPRVLVPRPETEVVVERCLQLLADEAAPRVLDIGVGSGAIALAIADEHPGSRVVATDNSSGALAVAEENRARAGLALRVELVHGELFAGLEGPFDLVVSNPPYVQARGGRRARAGSRALRASRGADRTRRHRGDRRAGAVSARAGGSARPRDRRRRRSRRGGAPDGTRLRGRDDRGGSRRT